MRKIPLLLSCLILTAAGCAKSRAIQLGERTDIFNRSLRWASLAAASTFIAEENRKTLMGKLAKDLNNNKIVDYSIIDLGLDAEKKNGSVVVEFSYYNLSSQDLSYRQEIQYWKYDAAKHDWFLVESRNLPQKNQR